ncbi:MAG: hypothetical protein PHE51_03900 [Eubacteriales bacterium]|nr:hypothetical protein [Eubacteriales bacterium]
MNNIVNLISILGLIFSICLVGAWDTGYITATDAVFGIISIITFVISGGFVCSFIASMHSTHRRKYQRRAYR